MLLYDMLLVEQKGKLAVDAMSEVLVAELIGLHGRVVLAGLEVELDCRGQA